MNLIFRLSESSLSRICICIKYMPLLIILLVAGTIIIPALIAKPSFAQIASHKENVVLTPILYR